VDDANERGRGEIADNANERGRGMVDDANERERR